MTEEEKVVTWDDINNLHMLYVNNIILGRIGWERVPAQLYPYIRFAYDETMAGK